MKFTVSYTDIQPDPKLPKPASPIELDPAFVFYQIAPAEPTNPGTLSNAERGNIVLMDTKGELREFQIVEIRPELDVSGSQTGYEMFVVFVPGP